MTTRRFLYLTETTGYHQEALDDESLLLGGLALTGNLVMGSNNITALGAATTPGDLISQAQVGAELDGLDLTGVLNMNTEQITYMADPGDGTDATTKTYVDNKFTAGVTWREIILDPEQLSNTSGILSAMALTITDQPHTGDTISLTNGTTTRTYGAGTGGDVQYTIGGSLAITMQNLADAIHEDGSGAWHAAFTLNLDAIDADGVVVICENSSATALSKIYGTWSGHQAECQIVDYTSTTDYNKTATSNLPTSAPGTANFGVHRVAASCNPGELHMVRENDCLYVWNDDASQWMCVAGPGSLADATSGSGGATKGKVGVDSDFGLKVNSGVLKIETSSAPGLYFATGNLSVKLHGTNPGLELTSSGLRAKWGGAKGVVVTATGLEVEIDDTPDTLDVTSAGLTVVGVPLPFDIDSTPVTTNVTATNLNTLTDSVSETALHSHPSTGGAERLEAEFTAGAGGVTLGAPVYISAANTMAKGQANTDSKAWIQGIAREAIGAGSPVPITFEGLAKDVLNSAGVAGTLYFLAATGGYDDEPPVAGNRVVSIGVGVNADDMLVAIRDFGKTASA